MYNGIGLQTPRGSGTNGHVQRNWAFVRPGKTDVSFKTEEDISKLDAVLNRQPNQDILDHERKRKIEVKCAEFEEILEKQGLDADNIKTKIDHYRVKLLGQGKGELPKDEFGRVSVRETHQIAEAQQEKNAKLREAFGISEYFVEGTSFDPDRISREAAAKSTSLKTGSLTKNQVEMKNDSKYALVRTPSREKDVGNIKKSSSKNKKKHRSTSSPDGNRGKKKKSKKHKKERSKKKHKKRSNKEPDSEPSDNSDSELDSIDLERKAKKRKKAKKDKKKRDKKKQRESSICQSASIEKTSHLHNTKENRQQLLFETSQGENDHKSNKDHGRQKKIRQISRHDTVNSMSEEKMEISRTPKRKQQRISHRSRSKSPKRSKKDQSGTPPCQIKEHSPTHGERSPFTNGKDMSRQNTRSKERAHQEISRKRNKKDIATKNETSSPERIKAKKRKCSSLSSRSRSHTPTQKRKDLSSESKRCEKRQIEKRSIPSTSSPSGRSQYQERKYSIEREQRFRRRSSDRSQSPIDKFVKKRDSNQAQKRINPFRSENSYRRRSNSPHGRRHTSPYYDSSYRHDNRRSFSRSPVRSRQRSSQRRGRYSPEEQRGSAKRNADACNDSAGTSSSKFQDDDYRISKRKSDSKHRESTRERNTKSHDSPTACTSNEIVFKTNVEETRDKMDSRLPLKEIICSAEDNDRGTDQSSHAEETLRSNLKRATSPTGSAKLSSKRGGYKESRLPSIKPRKKSPYSSDSESSNLSYSPAQREPERYLALLEEIKREAKEKGETLKNKVSPGTEPLKIHQSKVKDRRRSQIQHPQPSVHLHSPNEGDSLESENEEVRNRHVEKFIEAIVNEKKEETHKVPENDMKMLEALKSGIAAKAKEKIKTIEKMSTEQSPKSAFASTNSLNTFIETTQTTKVISVMPAMSSDPGAFVPYAESQSTSSNIRSKVTSADCSSNDSKGRSSRHEQSNHLQKPTIVIKPFKISELQPLTQSSVLHLKDNSSTETPKTTNSPGAAIVAAAVAVTTRSSRSRSHSKYASSGNESRTDSRASSRSTSTGSGSSRSRSRSSGSRYSQSSQSQSSSSASTPARSKSRSRSPSIPRRRGSPSFLDRRRITSARKRPIPYHRPTPSTMSSGDSSCGSRCSSPRSYHSLSKSRSPSNPF